MGLEDLTGTDKFVDDFVLTNPDGTTDKVQTLDDHVRGLKNVLNNCFAAITGAVTATHTELNRLAGVVAGTASASKALVVDASRNIANLGSVTASTFIGTLTGNVVGNAATATTANSIVGQGSLATLNSVNAATVDDGSITWANELAKTPVSSSFSVGPLGAHVLAAGVHNLFLTSGANTACFVQLYNGTTWVTVDQLYFNYNLGTLTLQVVSNGSHVRLYNVSSITSATFTGYQIFG